MYLYSMAFLRHFYSFALCIFFLSLPTAAAESFDLNRTIKLKDGFESIDVRLNTIPNLVGEYTKHFFRGVEIYMPPQESCSDKNRSYDYLEKQTQHGIDMHALHIYIEKNVAPQFFMEKQDVEVSYIDDDVVFNGNGRNGRSIAIEQLAKLMKHSIETGINTIEIPFIIESAEVVLSDNLKDMGVEGIMATGVSDFGRSPNNRVHNIMTGIAQFNGTLIQPGEIFSVGQHLGPVNGATGYLPELVIKGDKTEPDYGGGLCQVSTTAFRAVLHSGLSVVQRRNHSYSVSYYDPPGTDATIYYPSVDFKFQNDTESPIIMQAYNEGSKVYFTFYGKKIERQVEIYGPFVSNWRGAPPMKIEYTTDLVPGQRKKVGDAHNGFDTNMYRYVFDEKKEKQLHEDSFISKYQARPLFYLEGVESLPDESSERIAKSE